MVNVSAGSLDQAKTIIDAGAIPLMVEKLKARQNWEGRKETELNIAWCFMNLATDRDEFGKELIRNGVLNLLVYLYLGLSNLIDRYGRTCPTVASITDYNRCSSRAPSRDPLGFDM